MTEYLTTKELAELLRIKERKVYDLAASGSVPCSRATGKLLFPRKAVNEWLANHASNPASTSPRPLVIVGSHDPLFEWALRESRCGLASYFDSSLDGLERYASGDGIATGLHLYDTGSASWNITLVESRFSQARVVLVEWAKRSRGLIVQPDTKANYQGLADLCGKTTVPRQPEAGSQVLLQTLLDQQKVNAKDVKWTRAARSEADAVLDVVEGRADATFGLAVLAKQYRLGFVPIIDERYDIMVERRAWFEPAWQTFIKFCQSPEFSKHAKGLAGYDIDTQFRIQYNSE